MEDMIVRYLRYTSLITNINVVKNNQTPRRGQLDNLKRRIPKAKKTHKGGSHGKHS